MNQKPQIYLWRMAAFLGAIAVICTLLMKPLAAAFLANPAINGIILLVFVFGIFHVFASVWRLAPEVVWLEEYRENTSEKPDSTRLRLLAPMATMLGQRTSEHLSLSTPALRGLLDSIATRLDENREVTRYSVGLLVFLGLLGTFWGLLETIRSIADVVATLSIDSTGISGAFERLKEGLIAPMSGMATAFSSSLFGLAGSLVLGFLALQAGQAQSRFHNGLEDWLSAVTRLGSSGLIDDDQPIPAYIGALLEKTADNLEHMQRATNERSRNAASMNEQMIRIAERAEASAQQQKETHQVMMQSLGHLEEMRSALAKMAQMQAESADRSLAPHLQSFLSALEKLPSIMASDRAESIREIREEIRLLARTLSNTPGATTLRNN